MAHITVVRVNANGGAASALAQPARKARTVYEADTSGASKSVAAGLRPVRGRLGCGPAPPPSGIRGIIGNRRTDPDDAGASFNLQVPGAAAV